MAPYFAKYLTLTVLFVFVVMCSSSSKDRQNNALKVEQGSLKEHNAFDGVDFEGIMTECNKTYFVENEFLTALNETGSFPDETQTLPKCFIRCYYEKVGMMDENGNFNVNLMKQYFINNDNSSAEEAIIEKIVEACGGERFDICPCDKAYYTNRCIMEKIIDSMSRN